MVPVAVAPRETPAYGGGAGRLHNGTGAVSFFAAYGPLQKAAAYGGGRLLLRHLHSQYIIQDIFFFSTPQLLNHSTDSRAFQPTLVGAPTCDRIIMDNNKKLLIRYPRKPIFYGWLLPRENLRKEKERL